MSKILAIDDDFSILEVLQTMLSENGHQVLAANDADQAVALAARERPDLITLDFHMPGDGGVETLRRLRGNDCTAKTPIIFITGGNPADVLAQMPTDPHVSFMGKPIDMDLLARMVAELLGYPASKPPFPGT